MRKNPTGRLTESQPALQNVPIKTKQGKAIRDKFLLKVKS